MRTTLIIYKNKEQLTKVESKKTNPDERLCEIFSQLSKDARILADVIDNAPDIHIVEEHTNFHINLRDFICRLSRKYETVSKKCGIFSFIAKHLKYANAWMYDDHTQLLGDKCENHRQTAR